MSAKIHLNEWLDAMAALQTERVEKPEPGFFTMAEIREQIKGRHTSTITKIMSLVKAGRVEKKMFRRQVGNRVRPVPHYRLVKPQK